MAGEKIPIIYILSNTHSGSTLLDMLLGTQPKIWTLGEVQNLPRTLSYLPQPCGCGQPVEECSFWRELLPKIPLNEGAHPIGYFSAFPLRSREFRLDLLKDLMRGRPTIQEKEAFADYARVNSRLFSVIWETLKTREDGEMDWIVDASKNANRLYWLEQSQEYDLRVIRLVREVGGFVNSVTRPDHERRMVLLAARRWLVNNFIFVTLCKRIFKENRVYCLHYKKLASQPAVVLDEIGKWLGLEFPGGAHEHLRDYINHAISGNRTRWLDTGVQLDERWKKELPWVDAMLVRSLTVPFSKVMGF